MASASTQADADGVVTTQTLQPADVNAPAMSAARSAKGAAQVSSVRTRVEGGVVTPEHWHGRLACRAPTSASGPTARAFL